MGTKTLISPEEYLSTSYEWEPEYVRGELRERPMPDSIHGWIVIALGAILRGLRAQRPVAVLAETRCRMPNGNYRLPDVALFASVPPRVPTAPAVAVVEVLSKDEKHDDLIEKLIDFEAWAVPHIWVVNPRFRTLHEFRAGSLHAVDALRLPEYDFEVRYEQLVDGLPEDI